MFSILRLLATMLLLLVLSVPLWAADLYFPHIASDGNWETEIGIINNGQTPLAGTLYAYNDTGGLVETMEINLAIDSRVELTVGVDFHSPEQITNIKFNPGISSCTGYEKFYQNNYRVAVPAVSRVTTGDLYVPHIASNNQWWTGLSLLNTTAIEKTLTFTFNDGSQSSMILAAGQHWAGTIQGSFPEIDATSVQSAVISNASGVIGLELFGSKAGSGNYLSGVQLSDQTARTLYYPHVASDSNWWTGIVTYNPNSTAVTLTITPYDSQGTVLASTSVEVAAKSKYIGTVANLNLPEGTVWFKVESFLPVTGFELFGTHDGKQLAGYSSVNVDTFTGTFVKLEQQGWTGLAFVNISQVTANVTLTALDDEGHTIQTNILEVPANGKEVNLAEVLLGGDISNARYIRFVSDGAVAGFQLNASSNGMLLDALPGLISSVLPQIVLGAEVPVRSVPMTDLGGRVEILGTDTPLDGIQITFPAGALGESTELSIGYNEGSQLADSSDDSTRTSSPLQQPVPTLTIHTDGATNFEQLVEITVPYEDEQNVPIPYYVDENGQLRAVLVTNIDRINKTFTYVTSHASTWTWAAFDSSEDVDTEFRPAVDGFQIANLGSTINAGGECFGMTTFTQWYYNSKTAANGEFYPKYMNFVGRDSSDNNLTGQDVIATRAYSAGNQAWNLAEFILPNVDTEDEDRFNAIVSALKVTKRPVNLSIKKINLFGNFTAGHAVLAFGVDVELGMVFIYDPNKPDGADAIMYDTSSKSFLPYDDFTEIFLNGTGTYSLYESYENIFQDAEHNFTSDNMPHIEITSHQNGDTIYSRTVELSGVVESSEVLVSKLEVFVGSDKFSTNVEEDGSFTIGLTLESGEQSLRFVIGDEDFQEISPHNMNTSPFVLNVGLESAQMLVTLTWDKDDTDLDLYVIDPSGDYSAYYHNETADGGELDYDDTDGYGPEHWTLESGDTVRWDQNSYRVRVHYYENNDHGGTNYKLSVKRYVGTDRETESISTGYLVVHDGLNDGPLDTGDDWADFTFPIVLSSSSDRELSAVNREGVPVIPMTITTEVPSDSVKRMFKE